MDSVSIEVLKDDEVPAFIRFLKKLDFASGDEHVFQWYYSLPTTTMFAAKYEGRIIGSGMSYGFGRTGWLGSIGVDEEYRRKGLGTALAEKAIQVLEVQGCDSILLRASQEGASIYSSMGFRKTGVYENFLLSRSGLTNSEDRSYSLRRIDRIDSRFISLDVDISGEDRSYALEHLPPAGGYQILEGEDPVGAIYPSVGNGFIGLVENPDHIPALISRISMDSGFKVRTLVGSEGNRFLQDSGIKSVDGAVRMSLGKDPLKKIKNVVGTISSSIG